MQNSFAKNGELKTIRDFISDNNIVFDLGANAGDWSNSVLANHPTSIVHLFEPTPHLCQSLSSRFSDLIKAKQVFVNGCAVSDTKTTKQFYFYSTCTRLSTFYRRFSSIEKRLALKDPQVLKVPTTTLDSYCEQKGIEHIHFLKIDVEGAEFEAIRGAVRLLTENRIDFIQFEYGGTWLEAQIKLQDVFNFLNSKNYSLSKITPTGLSHLEQFSPDLENFAWCNFLAVSNKR